MTMTTPIATQADAPGWRFDNTYARLPEAFFARETPARAPAPRIVALNHGLAAALGLRLDRLDPAAAAAVFGGQAIPTGAEPIAQAYAGHQFGGFTMLGDGRAILLGEHRTPSGALVDIQFKGSGPTRFSRRGDGLAALGPMLREYLVSEAMHALGIPTTRSLAVVATGGRVLRETVLRGAILTRVAASHLRVGTFEYAAARRDLEGLRTLADYAIARHDPALVGAPDRHLGLLRAVVGRQAALVARWQLVGFVHGVMNTDNTTISGETIDYGPCAFLDRYDPGMVFSSIDHHGRYAFGNQAPIAHWNLARFAETLVPLLHTDEREAVALATAALGDFGPAFERHWTEGMRAKLGLATVEADDADLALALHEWMHAARADFTTTFCRLPLPDGPVGGVPRDEGFTAWRSRWVARLAREGATVAAAAARMRAVNPVVIPRNHQVEAALAAAEGDDLGPFERLLAAVQAPFDDGPGSVGYRDPAPDGGAPYRTFCGT